MQLYLNSLTRNKPAAFLLLQHGTRFVPAVWPSAGPAAGSALQCRVARELLLKKSPRGEKTQLVTAAAYSKEDLNWLVQPTGEAPFLLGCRLLHRME